MGMTFAGVHKEEFTFFLKQLTEKKLSDQQAKTVISERLKDGGTIESIIVNNGFHEAGESYDIASLIEQIMEANPAAVEEYKKGKLTTM